MDPQMSKLLKWSLENSAPSTQHESTHPQSTSFTSPTAYSSSHPPPSSTNDAPPTATPSRTLDTAALAALFNGPSDADLMKESMAAILSPSITIENKLVAFDNFEQLIEQIDNANNLEPLGLWTPLIELLGSQEGEIRRMAAWCVGTAVQNNGKAQERALIMGVIPALIKMCVGEKDEKVKRKALYALSSEMRNFQPGMDEAVRMLPEGLKMDGKIDAGDMDAVDAVIESLRQ